MKFEFFNLFFVYGVQVIRILILILVGKYTLRFFERKITASLVTVYNDPLRIQLIGRVVRYSGIFVIIAVLLFECGINVTALIGTAGVIGVAVSFAARTSVANVISGLFLMIEKPFELGDRIQAVSFEGQVVDVNLFAIMIRTHEGTLIRMPHEQLLKNPIVNMTKKNRTNSIFTIKLSNCEDYLQLIPLVERALEAAKISLNDLVSPRIIVKKIEEDRVELEISLWTLDKDTFLIQKTLPSELKKIMKKEQVSIVAIFYNKL